MTQTRRTAATLALVIATAGVGSAACGNEKPAESPPEPTENTALEEPKATPPPPAETASPKPVEEPPRPLAQVLVTDPTIVQKTYAATVAAPAATLKPSGAAGGNALAKGVRDTAKKLPAGMQPEGPLAMGNLKEKQHLQTDVTLAPGKCYSIVGYSQKVKDLDLYLFVPPGVLSGQDLTDDNRPIIGGAPQPMCPLPGTPVTYKLDIFADSGGGDVAVQLFSKSN